MGTGVDSHSLYAWEFIPCVSGFFFVTHSHLRGVYVFFFTVHRVHCIYWYFISMFAPRYRPCGLLASFLASCLVPLRTAAGALSGLLV
jgi:hypothetical protein